MYAYCDVSKMADVMKYVCPTTLADGLAKTIEWAREEPETHFNMIGLQRFQV